MSVQGESRQTDFSDLPPVSNGETVKKAARKSGRYLSLLHHVESVENQENYFCFHQIKNSI